MQLVWSYSVVVMIDRNYTNTSGLVEDIWVSS